LNRRDGVRSIEDGTSVRKIKATDLDRRGPAVAELIPKFALLSSDVICFVTREPLNNKVAYETVINTAIDAWRGVQNAERPSLVIIQNFASVPLLSSDEATKLLKQFDEKKMIDRNFKNSRCFQLPKDDPDLFFRDPTTKETVCFSDLFQAGIDEIKQ
jgi:hypothetical protein